MYRPIARKELVARIEHIRELHRQAPIVGVHQKLLHERREVKIKDFLNNLDRHNIRPMSALIHELEELFSLTTDGGYRLFGYELDGIREFDRALNAKRTHLVESYVFDRDIMVELPGELANEIVFERTSYLDQLVVGWQQRIPIRSLNSSIWRRKNTFHVHIGEEDSLGSALPPTSLGLVETVDDFERAQPDPSAVYLLQFPNGYRCSFCVISRGKLQLISLDRNYRGPQEFDYPQSVRIVGRVRAFAANLPVRERALRDLREYEGRADLILPWEHRTRASLLATKHRRFVRSAQELKQVQTVLKLQLRSKLSDRTRRRYRKEGTSEPHADALIQMSVEHFTRYSSVLRLGGHALRDRDRHSLEAMLKVTRFEDLSAFPQFARPPEPFEVWEARRQEIIEWSSLLSLKFPIPSQWARQVIRIGSHVSQYAGIGLKAGAWALLEKVPLIPDVRVEMRKRGWNRPIYAMNREAGVVLGHLEREGNRFALSSDGEVRAEFDLREFENLRRVAGIIVPL